MPVRYPCLKCCQPVKKTQNALLCVTCELWCHLKCTPSSENVFRLPCDWICEICIFRQLPFPPEDVHPVDPDKTGERIQRNRATETQETCDVELQLAALASKKGRKIVHLNIASLLKYLDELKILISKCPIDVITLSETHLDESICDEEIAISGYTCERRDRNRSGGGVAAYVREGLNYIVKPEFMPKDLEMMEIHEDKQKSYHVVTWYIQTTIFKF